MRSVTRSIDVKGSPAYMSPEHFFDFRRADQKADVYSLGKILFEAVAGKLTSEIPPLKRVCLSNGGTPFFQKLDRIIQKATAEDKEDRLESVELFRNEIRGIVASSNPEKPATGGLSPEHSLSSSILRHWLLAVVAVAATAIFSIAAVNFKDSTVDPNVPGGTVKQSQTDSYRALQPDLSGPTEGPQPYQTVPTDLLREWREDPNCDENTTQWQRQTRSHDNNVDYFP